MPPRTSIAVSGPGRYSPFSPLPGSKLPPLLGFPGTLPVVALPGPQQIRMASHPTSRNEWHLWGKMGVIFRSLRRGVCVPGLNGEWLVAATDSDLSEKSGESRFSQAFSQNALFLASGMQVFPSGLLMLGWQTCLGWMFNCL